MGEEGAHYDEYGVGTFILALGLGLLCRTYLAKTLHLPYTVLLLLLGMMFGGLHSNENVNDESWRQHLGYSLDYWINIPPEVLLYTFLPILIFESAASTDVHIFMRELNQVLMLAVPGVIVSTILTALVAKYIFPYDWDWNLALVFGAMMSATDPVAVVALLKELGVSERLGTLIEGESLLNDGTAYVVFLVFLEGVIEDRAVTSEEVIGTGARLALGGPIVGAVLGWAGSFLIGYILNDPLSEITMTVVMGFGAFIVAEGTGLHVSGILSIVTAGLFFSYSGRGRVSAVVEESLHSFWKMLGHVANTVIFFISGLIVANAFDGHVKAADWGWLIVLYVLLLVIRMINVLLCSPILVKGEYGVDWRQMIVISWGGLRGAVGLILALVVKEEVEHAEARRLASESTSGTSNEDGDLVESADRILFFMAGIAMLTLIINGSTTGMILHWLHLDRSSKAETELFVRACSALEAKMEHIVQVLKGDRMVGDADFKMVWRYIPLLTAKTYWHRIKAGNIELCDEEQSDIRMNWQHSPCWHRVMRWLAHKFCEPFVARHYTNVPPRMRSTWKHYHKAFRLDEHDVERIVETNRIHANLGNLGQGLVHHHSRDEAANARATMKPVIPGIGSSIKAEAKRQESLWLSGPNGIQNQFVTSEDETPVQQLHSTLDLEGLDTPTPPRMDNPTPPPQPDDGLKVPERKRSVACSPKTILRRSTTSVDDSSDRNSLTSNSMEETKEPQSQGGTVRFMEEPEDTPSRRLKVKSKNSSKDSGVHNAFSPYHQKENQSFLEKYKLKKRLIKELQQVEEELLLAQGNALVIANGEDELEDGDNPDSYQTVQLINHMTLTNHKTIRRKIEANKEYTKNPEKHRSKTMTESRMRLVHGYKCQFEDRFRRGWLTPTGLRILLGVCDNQLDYCDQPLNIWEAISESATISNQNLMFAAKMRTIWIFKHGVQSLMSYKLTHLFELAANFIKASEDIDVLQIVDQGPEANELALETLVQVKKARTDLRTHLPVFAEIARAMKTKVATRYLLIKQHELVEDFYHSGHINEKEMEILFHEIDRARRNLNYHPKTDEFPPRIKLIGHLPILRNMTKEEKEAFLKDPHFVEEEFHSQGLILIKEGMQFALQGKPEDRNGDVSHLKAGFYVVVRGSVQQTIYRRGLGQQTRILHAGTVFGLDDQLLGIPYKATYRTASFCHCFFFNSENILSAAQRNQTLNEGIWFTLAVSCVRHLKDFSSLDIKELYEIMKQAKFHEMKEDLEESISKNTSNKNSLTDTPLKFLKNKKVLGSTKVSGAEDSSAQHFSISTLFRSHNENLDKLSLPQSPMTFNVEPGTQLLLLKGRLLEREAEIEDGTPIQPVASRKSVAIIRDVEGSVQFTHGSIVFELGPKLLDKIHSTHQLMSKDVQRNLHIGDDYHQVKSASLRQGKLLGRASELRQRPSHPTKDQSRAHRMQRDLDMARRALELPETSPEETSETLKDPFPFESGDDFLMDVALGGQPGRSSRVESGHTATSFRSRAGTFDFFIRGQKPRSNTEAAAELGLASVAKNILNDSTESLQSFSQTQREEMGKPESKGVLRNTPGIASRFATVLSPRRHSRASSISSVRSEVKSFEDLYEAEDKGNDEAYNLQLDDSGLRPVYLAEQSLKIDGSVPF